MSTLVVDANGTQIDENALVICGEGEPGRVTAISDPDGDMDDEGRPFGISPRVYVLWPEAEDEKDVEAFSTMTSARWYDDDAEPWICGDLEITN